MGIQRRGENNQTKGWPLGHPWNDLNAQPLLLFTTYHAVLHSSTGTSPRLATRRRKCGSCSSARHHQISQRRSLLGLIPQPRQLNTPYPRSTVHTITYHTYAIHTSYHNYNLDLAGTQPTQPSLVLADLQASSSLQILLPVFCVSTRFPSLSSPLPPPLPPAASPDLVSSGVHMVINECL